MKCMVPERTQGPSSPVHQYVGTCGSQGCRYRSAGRGRPMDIGVGVGGEWGRDNASLYPDPCSMHFPPPSVAPMSAPLSTPWGGRICHTPCTPLCSHLVIRAMPSSSSTPRISNTLSASSIPTALGICGIMANVAKGAPMLLQEQKSQGGGKSVKCTRIVKTVSSIQCGG